MTNNYISAKFCFFFLPEVYGPKSTAKCMGEHITFRLGYLCNTHTQYQRCQARKLKWFDKNRKRERGKCETPG